MRTRRSTVVADFHGTSNDPVLMHWVLRVQTTATNFGGRRVWFECPSRDCQHRTRYLYVGINCIACRQCFRLLYPSQYHDPIGRAFDRLRRATERLRLSALDGGSSAKPKGMHWATFFRLLQNQRAAQQDVRELVPQRFVKPLTAL